MEDQNTVHINNNTSLAWSLVVVLAFLLVLAGSGILFLLQEKNTPAKVVSVIASPTPSVTAKSQIMDLNKQYIFPIKDSQGKKVGEFTFFITKIERTKEVMIGGNKATAIPGRELIILDAELSNKENLAASVVSRNYVRLKVNNVDKLSAPDFHPDPVDLQGQSTKDIRLGFSIAESDQNIILQIGELEGEKDIIPLMF